MSETTDIDEDRCPKCGHTFNQITAVGHDDQPVADDLTICLYCATMLKLDSDLRHVLLSEEEFEALQTELKIQLLYLRKRVIQRNAQKNLEAP